MSRSRGETPLTVSAPIRIVPAVGFSRPAISRSAVVFPQPDGPTRMRNSPSPMPSVRSSTANVPPGNSLLTFSNATSAMLSP